MNNKWYSLTRPAVVQFNPPRDTYIMFAYIMWIGTRQGCYC